MNVYREILHCAKNGSDKVYIVEVNAVGAEFIVVATWGPRNAPRLSNQIKFETTREPQAITYAVKLGNEKKRSKDKYEIAKKGLSITGFKQESVAITDVMAASKIKSNAVVSSTDIIGKARKLRI